MATEVIDFNALRKSCGSCALAQLCLPASIGADDLTRLDHLVQQRKPTDRGTTLFDTGSSHARLYVVRSGSFKTYVDLPDGDHQVLGFHLPGDLLGLDALPSERHRCSAEALERSTVCEVPFNDLSVVASKLPGLQQQLYRVMSDQFALEQEHMVMMGRRQAPARLAIFLHSLSERRKRLGLDPLELNLSMSRQDIANYLGLVIETVSRLMGRFQTAGVLEVERRIVRIRDMDALRAMAHGGDTPTDTQKSASSSS
ncbi:MULTISPECIES: fumarate/nitrate reduction transcriptional regulator Fnr [Oleiagrimonas]|uniref:fumarate/nitrate reduction transcriptional regulator Fnr n=1 Tax=Oleiagrimonas TaxID=1649642 RepID=UPI001F0BB31D|nr:fumarate/nitrate reduction transcriptional regulator Fnr [Oleiagrimonas sp. MCCC 1A03011]